MQYRNFIQILLLLLASGCFFYGLSLTLSLILISVLSIEVIQWTHALECREE